MVKRYAERIVHVDRPLYLYRQHAGQTYGGILNFTRDRIEFRAKRMLRLISALEDVGFEDDLPRVLAGERAYQEGLIRTTSAAFRHAVASVPRGKLFRMVLLRYAPWAASFGVRLLWRIRRGVQMKRRRAG
jgi:hypothetical protein